VTNSSKSRAEESSFIVY